MQEQLSRSKNRRIAGYVTIFATKKTDIKASQLTKLFCACSLAYIFCLLKQAKTLRPIYLMIRKILHHHSQLEACQFITFRTQESIDPYIRKYSNMMELSVSERQMKIDEYCDQSNKGCYLNGPIIDTVMIFIKSLEPEFYQLIAISIMPNHVHILIQQKQELRIIMQKIKGTLAYQINKLLARKGPFWEKSYFDKAIQDERHFTIIYDYIENNAGKANLADKDSRFYGIYSS